MSGFISMYGGGALLLLILVFAVFIVACKLLYELAMLIKTKPHKGFTSLHKRKHTSFLISIVLSTSAQLYTLFTNHLDFIVYVVNDSILLIASIYMCVAVYLVLEHLAEERKGM